MFLDPESESGLNSCTLDFFLILNCWLLASLSLFVFWHIFIICTQTFLSWYIVLCLLSYCIFLNLILSNFIPYNHNLYFSALLWPNLFLFLSHSHSLSFSLSLSPCLPFFLSISLHLSQVAARHYRIPLVLLVSSLPLQLCCLSSNHWIWQVCVIYRFYRYYSYIIVVLLFTASFCPVDY